MPLVGYVDDGAVMAGAIAQLGALAALEKVGQAPIDYIQRHAKGDWGEERWGRVWSSSLPF